MSTKSWTQVDLLWKDAPTFNPDAVVGVLYLVGIESTEELGSEYDPTSPWDVYDEKESNPSKTKGIRFYLPPGQVVERLLDAIRNLLGSRLGDATSEFTFSTQTVRDQDWMEEWKKNFDVLALSDHLWICPSWKTFQAPPGSSVIHMDPGLAFGTGHHASTVLIAQAMERFLVGARGRGEFPSVLDVGTGTGVLAMGAALLGASKVLAVDVDEVAVEVASENIRRNRLDRQIEVSSLPIDKIRRKFDLIVANILAETHITLMEAYAKRLAPGGTVLLSGIIRERMDRVKGEAQRLGWVVVGQREESEWVCATLIQERRRQPRTPLGER